MWSSGNRHTNRKTYKSWHSGRNDGICQSMGGSKAMLNVYGPRIKTEEEGRSLLDNIYT